MACRTPAELRRHIGTHDTTKRFQCVMCSSMLKSESSLKLHIREMHERPREKVEVCQVAKLSRFFRNYKNHLLNAFEHFHSLRAVARSSLPKSKGSSMKTQLTW